jgi:hypothetical protein
VEKDQFFVTQLLEKHIGAEVLGTHTLGGSLVFNPETGKTEIGNTIDKDKLDYLYLVYCKRVESVGINANDRTLRKRRAYFNGYVKMAAEKFKKQRQRKLLKAKSNDNDEEEGADN